MNVTWTRSCCDSRPPPAELFPYRRITRLFARETVFTSGSGTVSVDQVVVLELQPRSLLVLPCYPISVVSS